MCLLFPKQIAILLSDKPLHTYCPSQVFLYIVDYELVFAPASLQTKAQLFLASCKFFYKQSHYCKAKPSPSSSFAGLIILTSITVRFYDDIPPEFFTLKIKIYFRKLFKNGNSLSSDANALFLHFQY